MRVSVLDYGAGNVRSLVNALNMLGCEVDYVTTAEEIDAAPALIFPGVGAFGSCMEVLEELYTSSENAALRKRLIDLQVANRITAALQNESESEAFAKAAMGLLQGLTRSCDAEELGLDADSLKILNDVVNKHRANPFVATEGEALMNSLSAALGQEGAEMIGRRFDMAVAAMEGAGGKCVELSKTTQEPVEA